MNFTIRKAEEKDFPAILSLIREIAAFNNETGEVTNSEHRMRMEKDFFQCLVAETENEEIAGIASYFFAYYTYVGKSLYLDDLHVKEGFRGQKIGTQLLQNIIEIAKNENCHIIRWLVYEWNKPAVEMYKKLGAKFDKKLLICTLEESKFK